MRGKDTAVGLDFDAANWNAGRVIRCLCSAVDGLGLVCKGLGFDRMILVVLVCEM